MMKNDHYRQSLVLSHLVYLSYDLSACYETSRLQSRIKYLEQDGVIQ